MKPSSARRKRLVARLFDSQDGICCYCERPFDMEEPTEPLVKGKVRNGQPTLDHKVPLLRGGTWHIDNLVLACFKCNHIKSDGLIPDDILDDRATLTQMFRSGQIKKVLVRDS